MLSPEGESRNTSGALGLVSRTMVRSGSWPLWNRGRTGNFAGRRPEAAKVMAETGERERCRLPSMLLHHCRQNIRATRPLDRQRLFRLPAKVDAIGRKLPPAAREPLRSGEKFFLLKPIQKNAHGAQVIRESMINGAKFAADS